MNSWNNHPIEGCKNISLLQLREAGFLERFGSNSKFIRDIFDGPDDIIEDEFGVDCEENTGVAEEIEETVVSVRAIVSSLPQNRIEHLRLRLAEEIDPLCNNDNFGISSYHKCLEIAQSMS